MKFLCICFAYGVLLSMLDIRVSDEPGKFWVAYLCLLTPHLFDDRKTKP